MALAVTVGGTGTNSGLTAAVGDKIIVCQACDNAGTDGASSTTAPTCPKTGTFTQRASNNYDPGTASAGATATIWQATVTSSLGSTDQITIYSSATAYMCATAYKVTAGSGAVCQFSATTNGTAANSNAPTVTTESIAIGYLVVGSAAIETDDAITAASDTDRGSWTTVSNVISDAGPDSITMRPVSQAKVTTTAAGTQTYNLSYSTARDVAITAATFYELVATNAPAEVATTTAAGYNATTNLKPVAGVAAATAAAPAVTPKVEPRTGGTLTDENGVTLTDENGVPLYDAHAAYAVAAAHDATVTTAPGTDAPAGLATVTAIAYAATVRTDAPAGLATVTATAYAATVRTDVPAPAATSATATAHSPTVRISPAAGQAAATASAISATATVTVLAGIGTATATAYDATVSSAATTNAPAGLASATAAAANATVRIGPAAGHATATAPALAPATATVAAIGPAFTVTVPAQIATVIVVAAAAQAATSVFAVTPTDSVLAFVTSRLVRLATERTLRFRSHTQE